MAIDRMNKDHFFGLFVVKKELFKNDLCKRPKCIIAVIQYATGYVQILSRIPIKIKNPYIHLNAYFP